MLDQLQTDHNDVFDLFEHQESGKIRSKGFINALNETNLSKNTQILQQMIGNREELTKQQYKALFTNNVKDQTISSAFFHQLSNQKQDQFIDLNGLLKINSEYNLGFKTKDMQLIVNMIGKDGKITLIQLQTMLSQY